MYYFIALVLQRPSWFCARPYRNCYLLHNIFQFFTLNLRNLTQNESQAGGSQSWPPRVRKLAVCFKSNSDPLKSKMHQHRPGGSETPPRPLPRPNSHSHNYPERPASEVREVYKTAGAAQWQSHSESALSTRSLAVPSGIQFLPDWFKSSSLENAGRAGRQSHNVLEGAAPPRGQLRWKRR